MTNSADMSVDIVETVNGVLEAIHKTVESMEVESMEDNERLLSTIESLQDASLDDQSVFVIRLLLDYLDEDKRKEALRGFIEEENG